LNATAAVLGLAMRPLADRLGNRLMLLARMAATVLGALWYSSSKRTRD
jgi:hypothetical protein